MNKILSIVIPSYNMQDYLPACLDSLRVDDPALFNQLDIIVVNDGSKDRTSAIAHEYVAQHPDVIRAIDKPNGNYGSCVNRGLAEAKGTFIKILDADDTFDMAAFKSFIRRLIESEEKNEQVDLFLTDFVWLDANGEVMKRDRFSLCPNTVLDVDSLNKLEPLAMMQAVAYRTAILHELVYRQTEGISYTDLEWASYPMAGVRRIYYFPHVIYRYLAERPGQTMEPVRFHVKDLPMRGKVSLRMIKELADRQKAGAPSLLMLYLRKFALFATKGIYVSAILLHPSQQTASYLTKFDKEIERLDPQYHAYLMRKGLSPSRGYMPYGKIWARTHDVFAWDVRLVRMLLVLALKGGHIVGFIRSLHDRLLHKKRIYRMVAK